MNIIRKILFPVAFVYWAITSIRNWLYNVNFFKSTTFDIPIIAVGNLSVGGTGKTPQIEYLIRLLSEHYRVATLSRGYKRKSKGFILADDTATIASLGDEPLQFYEKFKNIQVAVDANRINGITELLNQKIKPQIILLDDAYQHRKVKAGFYILLTTYHDLFVDDYILPFGNLREPISGVERANIVVVTKCPNSISKEDKLKIKNKLKLKDNQQLFYSCIDYDDNIYSESKKLVVNDIRGTKKLLIAGIAKPLPFYEYLKDDNDTCLTFPDHHNFTQNDIDVITEKAKENLIITTEKDYVRLNKLLTSNQLYYLPIKSIFVSDSDKFNKTILDYVGKSSRNS